MAECNKEDGNMNMDRRHLIAQWAFDTRAILGRFHIWLKDV